MPPETPLPEKSVEQVEYRIVGLEKTIDKLKESPILRAYIQAGESCSDAVSTKGFPEDQLKKLIEVVKILRATPEGQVWEQILDVISSRKK